MSVISESRTMRDAFLEALCARMRAGAHAHSDIFFLSADFGAPLVDVLRSEFPRRFINVGIAEQNLINVATGLALEGYTVFCYAIAPFVSMRAYEQIRINCAMLSQVRPLNINIIAVGAGLSYDVSGPTHHCLEDIGIMRVLPNIDVISPADWKVARLAFAYCCAHRSPKYVRLDGKPLAHLSGADDAQLLSRGWQERVRGNKICIVATGYMVHKALRVAAAAAADGLRPGVIDVTRLQGADTRSLAAALCRYAAVLTLEEGFIGAGGLDAFVSDSLRRAGSRVRMSAAGFDRRYVFEIGAREQLLARCGLSDDALCMRLKRMSR